MKQLQYLFNFVFLVCGWKEIEQENKNTVTPTFSFLPIIKLHWTVVYLALGCSLEIWLFPLVHKDLQPLKKCQDHPIDLEELLATIYVILFIQHK